MLMRQIPSSAAHRGVRVEGPLVDSNGSGHDRRQVVVYALLHLGAGRGQGAEDLAQVRRIGKQGIDGSGALGLGDSARVGGVEGDGGKGVEDAGKGLVGRGGIAQPQICRHDRAQGGSVGERGDGIALPAEAAGGLGCAVGGRDFQPLRLDGDELTKLEGVPAEAKAVGGVEQGRRAAAVGGLQREVDADGQRVGDSVARRGAMEQDVGPATSRDRVKRPTLLAVAQEPQGIQEIRLPGCVAPD